MKKWICEMCGYKHSGETAPARCPTCGASKSRFYQKRKQRSSVWCLLFCIFIFAMLVFALFCVFSCSSPLTVDNSAVSTVDLNRYMGKWYEIARFDHRFERDMTQCTATYTLLGDDKVEIENKGLKDGEWKISMGKGKLTETPGVFDVSFFGPFYSDYRIMMLASDYSYALVGGDSDDYLWILSRSPKLKQDTLDKIVAEAKARGYKTEDLIWVEQSINQEVVSMKGY